MKIISLDTVEERGANFILEKYLPIPENAVTLLSALGGTGKTRLALVMASKYIEEKNYKHNVALWLTEDFEGQVKKIFNDLVKDRIVNALTMANMLLILDEPPQLAKRDKGLFKANYEAIKEIGSHLIERNVKLAVFDPLLAFYGGNENDNSEARVFIQSFASWAKSAEITTIIIHHASKEGGSRGATAFHDGVRARYELDVPKDKDGNVNKEMMAKGFRIAKLKKDNWGIRKHLWKLTDGNDEITLKVAPPLINAYEPVEEVEFTNDGFLGGIL